MTVKSGVAARNRRVPADPGSRRGARVQTAPRLVSWLFATLAVVGGVQALAMIGVEIDRYLYSSREVASLRQDVAQLERDIAALREILAHRDDERFREQLARQQGFVYPNETLYRTLR